MMEPLKPAEKLEILQRAESADASEVEEYEKLLSQRFTTDPDAATPESVPQGGQDDRSRLRELYKKFAKRING
jgi:hypothetical protein